MKSRFSDGLAWMTNSNGLMISLSEWGEEPGEGSDYSSKTIYTMEVALRLRHSITIFYHQGLISNALL